MKVDLTSLVALAHVARESRGLPDLGAIRSDHVEQGNVVDDARIEHESLLLAIEAIVEWIEAAHDIPIAADINGRLDCLRVAARHVI